MTNLTAEILHKFFNKRVTSSDGIYLYKNNEYDSLDKLHDRIFKQLKNSKTVAPFEESMFSSAFFKWISEQIKENNADVFEEQFSVARVPNRTDVELFSRFKLELKSNFLYYCSNAETNTYEIDPKAFFQNPSQYATPEDCPLEFTPASNKAGEVYWKKTPASIGEYYSKVFPDMIEGGHVHGHVHFDNKLVDFTNDASIPNLSHFDLQYNEELLNTPTPTLDVFLTSMTEDEQNVFRAWVYGLFYDKNNGRQVLYLQNNGFGGKSSFLDGLTQTLGMDNVAAIDATMITNKNKFRYSGFLGKRLALWADCKTKNAISSELIHNLTGSDPVTICFMNKDSFAAFLSPKVLMCSNDIPTINMSETHEVSRLIVINLKEYSKEVMTNICETDENGKIITDMSGPVYTITKKQCAKMMADEMPAFLAQSKEIYKKLCPSDSKIIIPKSIADNMKLTCQREETDEFCDVLEFFEDDPNGFVSSQRLLDILSKTKNKQLDFNSNEWNNFYKWMRNPKNSEGKYTKGRKRYNGSKNAKQGFIGLSDIKSKLMKELQKEVGLND